MKHFPGMLATTLFTEILVRKIHYSKGLEVPYLNGKISLEESLCEIKRDITLFDQIIYPTLRERLRFVAEKFYHLSPNELRIQFTEFEYLLDQNLIRDFSFNKNEYLIHKAFGRMSDEQKSLFELSMSITVKFNDEIKILSEAINKDVDGPHSENYKLYFCGLQNARDQAVSMAITEILKCNEGLDIVNSLEPKRNSLSQDTSLNLVSKSNVYEFLLHDLPLPSDITPWQDILDYKGEKNNTRRLALLRNWTNKVLKEQYKESELVDEYEALYMDFEESINRQKIKSKRTVLKILFVGLPELAEDFIKLRFKNIGEKVYKGLFEASSEMIALADAEAGAPGRELAYMFFSKEQFQKK